jgi:DNA repair protein RadC
MVSRPMTWDELVEVITHQNQEIAKLRKVAEAARRVMDAVMAQPQDVKERNIALAWLDAALAELDKEGER